MTLILVRHYYEKGAYPGPAWQRKKVRVKLKTMGNNLSFSWWCVTVREVTAKNRVRRRKRGWRGRDASVAYHSSAGELARSEKEEGTFQTLEKEGVKWLAERV